MPDLNFNPLVLNYLTQNAIWWIEYADLDGFRVDTNYSDPKGIAKWTKQQMNIPHLISWARYGCRTVHKWRIGKRQSNRSNSKLQFDLHQ
jgi:1,4-alpha-glucan branching enzyme